MEPPKSIGAPPVPLALPAPTRRRHTRVDFSKLSWGTLRKYQYYFRVKSKCDEPPEDEGQGVPRKRDREAVIEAVRSHFE